MLLPESELRNYVLATRDGDIGRARDFLFDDTHWAVRYMEINTSKWLLGRRVLISPFAIEEPDISLKNLHVGLTREDIENAPGIDRGAPVSRRYEEAYHAHYGYPNYWIGEEVWGARVYPRAVTPKGEPQFHAEPPPGEEDGQSRLRSMEEMRGYDIHTSGEDVGQVADFIVDTDSWQIRYLVVDIRRWLPGPSVLLVPQWVLGISWTEKQVNVDVQKSLIKTAPRFCLPLTRDDEAEVFNHYGRTPYWQSFHRRAASN